MKPYSLFSRWPGAIHCAALCLSATVLLGANAAHAGISYQLDTTHASAGETVRVKGVLFNDTQDALNWTPPSQLVLQWRDSQGGVVRTLARLETPSTQVNLPVNNFVAFSWRAVVPAAVRGLQALSVEGTPALLALDTSPRDPSPITGQPAAVPVVDAGSAGSVGADTPLPSAQVAAAGANPYSGPAPGQAVPMSAFDHFRNAISPYEPIYFDFGNRDGANARFQISFKYRLSTPDDPSRPGFLDHLYLGYTQTALWDLEGTSVPFVDTTYNPSLFWRKDSLWSSQSQRHALGLTTGVEHRSNGKGGPDSRSVNDVFIQPEYRYRFEGGSTLSFAPRVKAYFGVADENPDYADYAGHVDWKLRWAQDDGLVLSALYRQGRHGRNATQLEAAWPLRRTFLNINGYVHLQYFSGYGETLLGYREKSAPQVRLGLALVP